MTIWGKNILGRRKNKCKGPEAGLSYECEGTARRPDSLSSPGGLESSVMFLVSLP